METFRHKKDYARFAWSHYGMTAVIRQAESDLVEQRWRMISLAAGNAMS
jgi:hypothetical protein